MESFIIAVTGGGIQHEDPVVEASYAAGHLQGRQCQMSIVPGTRRLSDFCHAVKLQGKKYLYAVEI